MNKESAEVVVSRNALGGYCLTLVMKHLHHHMWMREKQEQKGKCKYSTKAANSPIELCLIKFSNEQEWKGKLEYIFDSKQK